MANMETGVTNSSIAQRLQAMKMNADGNILRLLVTVVVIFILLSIALPDIFPTVRNMQSMAFQASEIGILAIAITVTLISAGIDLSIVSTANLTGIIAGLVLGSIITPESPTNTVVLGITLAILAGLAVGITCGLFNGYLIAGIGMPPILATLGTMLIYKGIGTGITKGTTIFGVAQSQFIGNGNILQIPFPLILLILIAIIMSIVLGRTRFGLRLYMMGTNPSAARFSGINNRRVLIISYVISGVLASVAGIIFLGRTNAANVDFGTSYVLLAILIAVLGDVDPYGGSGTVLGVLLALAGLQFLSTGFNMLLFHSSGANFFKEFSWGVLLLIVLILNYYSQRREKRLAIERSQKTMEEINE